MRHAARVRVEGSRDALMRIARELGIAEPTLRRWMREGGWVRPAAPDRAGPGHYRSRRIGRGYGGDAVGLARDLVTGSTLPAGEIARRVGIGRATLYRWMKRPGWERPVPAASGRPGAGPRRHAAYRPPYGPEIVAAARELYETTRLPPSLVAARVGTPLVRLRHWAHAGGWTRPPRDLGYVARRRRRPPG